MARLKVHEPENRDQPSAGLLEYVTAREVISRGGVRKR